VTTIAVQPIWDALIGQQAVVDELQRAVTDAEAMRRGEPGRGMTHAWLITGPPGSGRSTAATCFAAALTCPEHGCGQCSACRNAPRGGHPDVEVIRPEGLSYGVEQARALVLEAARSPIDSPWRVLVVEDADRMTEEAVNVLLKAIEEPTPHTVWLLCAPSVEDVLPTIVSRTRHVHLRTPSTADVAALLVERHGIDPAMAAFAARASQGHIGRARALALDEHARIRRQDALRKPLELRDLAACMLAASELLDAATDDARAITDPLDEAERERLLSAYGEGSVGVTKTKVQRLVSAAMKQQEKQQKTRATRTIRDQIDRSLTDLLGLYRDVFAVQMDSDVSLINEEMRPQIEQLAADSQPHDTGKRLQALQYARAQIGANVAPQLVLEALMVKLKDPWIAAS
jgi:DNA polymerase-3 subunit delta'